MTITKFMKFKLSPFIVLFVSLNSILIFCATRNVDAKKTTSTGLTHTNEDSQLSPDDNFDAAINYSSMKNTKLPATEVSYYIGYIIPEKGQSALNPIVENSVEGSFAHDSGEQQTKRL
jgi:hypothetical protein